MKSLVATLLALAICLVTSAGYGRNVPPPLMKKVMKEIGLSEGQIKKIEDLAYLADREKLDIQHELRKARLELQHLMSADKPIQAKVFSQLENLSAVELKLKKNRLGLMLKIRELLTSEQWEKLEIFQASRRAQHRERRLRHRLDQPPEPPQPPPPPER